jgi:hypothetical protein
MSKYNKETLEPIVETSLSIAEVCRRLEIRSNYTNEKIENMSVEEKREEK